MEGVMEVALNEFILEKGVETISQTGSKECRPVLGENIGKEMIDMLLNESDIFWFL